MLYQEHELKTNIFLSEKIIQGLELLSASIEEIEPLIRQEVIENPVFDLEKFHNETFSQQDISTFRNSYSKKESYNHIWWENIPNNNSTLSQLYQISKQFFQDPIDLNIIEHIIGSLNKNGCLDCSLEELAILTESNVAKIQSILDISKQIFPPGIASFNLKECVLTQLKNQTQHNQAYQIINKFFDEHLNYNINTISKKTCLSKEKITQILRLSLAHISFYSIESTNIFYNKTVLPDIIADYKNNKWLISVNECLIPSLNINYKFLSYLQKDNYVKEFIKKNFIKAKNLIENIEKRRKTLVTIFSYLIHFHSDFLNGLIQFPQVLTIKEISQNLSLHKSTISRALRNKTLMCNGTIISVKQLIASYAFNNQETISSSDSVKQLIKELIEKEDHSFPLSDKQISEQITSLKNIICSRRTIAKYRISLGIPSMFERKKFFYKK